MEWNKLLCTSRFDSSGSGKKIKLDQHRTEYQRDSDRVIFSSAFKRLSNKTQVFAFPENDHVHSRLTHSLIVSSIGKSLGVAIGEFILKKEAIVVDEREITKYDFGEIVASACLAHDIGNPPFGHSGEKAISEFFRRYFSNDSVRQDCNLTEFCRADLENFEGNAQGFRLLSRTLNSHENGLQLTAAILTTFTKYPFGSSVGTKNKDGYIKYGYFQSEKDIFLSIAQETGLTPKNGVDSGVFARHPLAYLVEAADDITYQILDIEDGAHLGHVPIGEAKEILTSIAKDRHDLYYDRDLDDAQADLAFLRGISIRKLREEVYHVFVKHYSSIMRGTFGKSLLDHIPSKRKLDRLHEIVKQHCYLEPSVLSIQLAGFEVLGGLLEMLVPAVIAEQKTTKQQMLLDAIGYNKKPPPGDQYERILRITDFVSGMTDSYAVSLFQKFSGMSLPKGPHI